MTLKQQLATAFLAALIVCSVGFMPAQADIPGAKPMRPVAKTVAVRTNQELPQNQVRDLTYN